MRALTVALCAAACFAPVSPCGAATGYTPVGPPATLHSIVFANDGTLFGTVDRASDAGPLTAETAWDGPQAALWRSTDHGHTWSAVYRAPAGVRMAVLDVSPSEPASVYVTIDAPTETNRFLTQRIDVATGAALTLPAGRLEGIDAAGTAYLITPVHRDYAFYSLIRCSAAASACETVPTLRNLGSALVDRNSVGLLVSAAPKARPNSLQPGPIEISRDGGLTWTPGATLPIPTPALGFAGPAPGTLYSLTADETSLVSVSHDAGVTWSPPQPVALTAGVVLGTRPSVAFRTGTSELISSDGVSFRSVTLASPADRLAIDPADPNHMVSFGGYETDQTWDGGGTWSDVADAQFGTLVLDPDTVAGSGSYLYALGPYSIWVSRDRGSTWTRSRWPFADGRGRVLVSRDDPRTAYVSMAASFIDSTLRTRDGGRTWQPVAFDHVRSPIRAIQPGDPVRLLGAGGGYESRDGGTTWVPVAAGETCTFGAIPDPSSPTGQRLRCDGWAAYDPRRPLQSSHLPNAVGLFGSPDRPGAFAVAYGSLLGDITSDWSWSPLLAPTNGIGPSLPGAAAVAAWPARGGTTFYARDSSQTMWVRRGTGRWWRLQQSGHRLWLFAALDATHALVRDLESGGPLGIVDLTTPAVAPPHVQDGPGGLGCAVPWSAADATTTGIAWLRDGVVLQGMAGSLRARSKYDRGHDITCRVTARMAWGSVALASDNVIHVGGKRLIPPRPRVRGAARVGGTLRCSARAHVSWLRGTVPARAPHRQTYVVRVADAGRAIACQTRLADGTVTRSRPVKIRP